MRSTKSITGYRGQHDRYRGRGTARRWRKGDSNSQQRELFLSGLRLAAGETRRRLLAADGGGRRRHARTPQSAVPRAHRPENRRAPHGRIVKTTGDGMLVGFASVVDAVRCAVAAQQAKPHELSCCLPISLNE